MSNRGTPHRRTRSGRSIVRTDSPLRSSPALAGSPKKKRAPKPKSDKPKNRTPRLTAPLSILTKDLVGIPVRDMQAWANRSAETRLEEARKRNGYITRPMNSFMLYRSAYAERTKAWCAHNNHQVVSAVSGESWPLEPAEVRDFYNELSRIERTNHHNAHPTYKFCPAKPGFNGRKRKGTADSESELSDLGDPDADWASTHKARLGRNRPGRDAGYPSRVGVEQLHHEQSFSPNNDYNKSPWDTTQAHRQAPQPLLQPNLYRSHAEYYQEPGVHNSMLAGIEDVRYNAMQDTSAFSSSLVALPGGMHHELQMMRSHGSTPLPSMEAQIDPMLIPYNGGMPANMAHAAGPGHGDLLHGGLTNAQLDSQAHAAQLHFSSPFGEATEHHVAEYQQREWRPESTSPTYEQGSEFENYWDSSVHAEASAERRVEKEDLKSPRSM
jgi:HMG (high mobility group) box